jgi:hypothetical protein
MNMDIYGDYLWEMNDASFGNFSHGLPLRNVTDRRVRIDIPPYVNISKLDNFTTYGDNRAQVELENRIVGRSRDQYTFTYINHFKITDAYPN